MKNHTECFIYYRKYILKITQPSPCRYTQLQYRFAVTSEAPSIHYMFKKQLPIFIVTYYINWVTKLLRHVATADKWKTILLHTSSVYSCTAAGVQHCRCKICSSYWAIPYDIGKPSLKFRRIIHHRYYTL